jgi:hypothetical protein
MAAHDPAFDARMLRRIYWIILILGIAGSIALAIARGPRAGAGFLIGAAVSYLSFWRWEKVVNALGKKPARRSFFWMLRFVLLAALAYVIIRFARVDLKAALAGLLVSAAAVIIEIVYELIYART